MFIAKFFMASSLKKNRPLTLIVWVRGRLEKNVDIKVGKIIKHFSFVFDKY